MKKQQPASEPSSPVINTVPEKTGLMQSVCKSEKQPLVDDNDDDNNAGSTNIISKSQAKFRRKIPAIVSY